MPYHGREGLRGSASLLPKDKLHQIRAQLNPLIKAILKQHTESSYLCQSYLHILSIELQLRSSQRRSDRGSATPVSPSSFVQQGTVDWPNLARASVNASVSVLTRLSGCGLELWTASVAQVILGTIHLSAEGESHLNDALAKLHSFSSHSNAIYFGFGVKHIIRTLADSSEGMATVALCSSIAEVHGLAISTQIVQ